MPYTNPLNVLRTLIAQLAQQSDGASKLLTTFLENNPEHIPGPRGQSASLGMDRLGELLRSVSQCFERVSLVINSLDSFDLDTEGVLVRLLAALDDRPESNIWVLFTSADYPGCQQQEQQLIAETKCCPVYAYGRGEDIRL